MIILPYYAQSISARLFDSLFADFATIAPTLVDIWQGDASIGHVDIRRYSGIDALRIAWSLDLAFAHSRHEKIDQYTFISKRLGYLLRDVRAVGELPLSSDPDPPVFASANDAMERVRSVRCRIEQAEKALSLDPYIYGVLLSGLLRSDAIRPWDAATFAASRTLRLGTDQDSAIEPAVVTLTIERLLDGSLDYEMATDLEVPTAEFDERRAFHELLEAIDPG